MIDITLLNSAEKNAIEELRERVENVMLPNFLDDRLFYYRFLKARDFNLDKAEKMLRKHIQWRKHHQISTLIEDLKPKEFYLKIVEPTTIGFDKEGDVVTYIPSGQLDGRDVLKCILMNDYMKHFVWHCEKWHTVMKLRREKEGMKTQQVSLVVDLNRLTLANATSKASAETILRIMHLLQDNYPETLKSINVINAPSYYVIIYTLVKPLMSTAFQQKVHIYGHSGWKETFLETIDAEVLPAFLGGKRTDPDGDPACRTFISHGGWMPKCYYLTDEDRSFTHKSRVTKISVPQNFKKDVYFDVMEEGSVIQWEFLVKDKDIGFGLFLQGSDDVVEILPIQKYDTMDGVEKGSYKSKFTGKYIITFDNSYSWFNSKEVEYCITVLKNEI